MRNPNYLPLLFLFVLAGCSPAPELVYVDIDQVPLIPPKIPVRATPPRPSENSPTIVQQRTVGGVPGVDIENLRAEEKQIIRQEVRRETEAAIATMTERLKDYYNREIAEFYKNELARLVPLKDALNEEYLKQVRVIFEKYATTRGPLLIRLTFLTEFPPPDKLIPLEGENLTKGELAKRNEIRDLQRQISDLDVQYILEIEDLEKSYASKLEQEAENIDKLLAQKQDEINAKAEDEASRLVRRFSSGLAERIFSKYTFHLKEIPTKTVNFPQIPAPPGVPRVTFDRTPLVKDNKAELTKELDTFLTLKRYERVSSKGGARDVTKEFIEWRMNLKSGHWENWERSSAPK